MAAFSLIHWFLEISILALCRPEGRSWEHSAALKCHLLYERSPVCMRYGLVVVKPSTIQTCGLLRLSISATRPKRLPRQEELLALVCLSFLTNLSAVRARGAGIDRKDFQYFNLTNVR